MKYVQLSDIPPDFFDSITKHINNYTVGLTVPEETRYSANVRLCGTGTLVEINGHYGILTAYHVIEGLLRLTEELTKIGSKKPSDIKEIGLILDQNLHRPKFPLPYLNIIKVARGEVDKDGPDLGLIIFPPIHAGTIKSLKSFYNLGLRREQVLHNPPGNYIGLWFLCGFIDEFTTDDQPSRGYDRVKGFRGKCILLPEVNRAYCIDDYDYFEFEVLYNEDKNFPMSYGGMSGGGVWQLTKFDGKSWKARDLIFSGVIFYQNYDSSSAHNRLSIKSHGRQSIYKYVVDYPL